MESSVQDKHMTMPGFLEHLHSKYRPLMVFDGAMGTSFQKYELCAEDFGGVDYEGCNENLVLTRPDLVESVHKSFLSVGCDVIETNTFGANSIVLDEYGIGDKTFDINCEAALLASRIAQTFSSAQKPRFVAGSIGPTTKLPSLGHIEFDQLRDAYELQACGLLKGGVDLFIVETCQDVLQIKSALQGIHNALIKLGEVKPIMVSVTIEANGTMLLGTDIAAVVSILEPFAIDVLGLNCATGPEQMKEHIRFLSENSPFAISCIPNAGLPENIGGRAHYRLSPIELKMQLMHFVEDLGVQIIGGCCGTTSDHIASLCELANELTPAARQVRNSTKIIHRKPLNFEPSASSIYNTVSYKQDKSFLIIGERLNASGSKKVRELLNKEDWDGLVAIGRSQLKENAHMIDINVDFVGRDGNRDMYELVRRIVTNINLPLMLDSTEFEKMESGLKVSGGKSILNSTNYEDGEDRFFKVLSLAKNYGCGVVIGTIDEEGMARTAKRKFSIASRAFHQASEYGIPSFEIFYDPLALPISTGIEEDRRNAVETIDSIKLIRESFPDVHIILGVSNISFGLNPSARIVLNSVFLHECCIAGLDSAIISPAKILPLGKVTNEQKKVCLDLIYDKRVFQDGNCIYDPLTSLTSLFDGVSTKEARSSGVSLESLPVEERLKSHIIDGERIGLEQTLKSALTQFSPLEIINKYLLDGMKVVGELFGAGEMQLPFVLQSAQTMKSAVSFLEPYMEKDGCQKDSKAKLIIATVKGDVHDIGKNLVDIILTNNGYDVINLGIKQDVAEIIKAQKIHQADCIAMSGLLVKSTAFMKDNLSAFNENGISVPVILGGAALTPRFVNKDCSDVYEGKVIYGKDAFTDLRFMEAYVDALSNDEWDNFTGFLSGVPEGVKLGGDNHDKLSIENIDNKKNSGEKNITSDKPLIISKDRSNLIPEEQPIQPPFLGAKSIYPESINFDQLLFFLDKNALYSGQWQMRKSSSQSVEQYQDFIRNKAEPVLDQLIQISKDECLIRPSVVYGYFPCGRQGNDLKVFSTDLKNKLGEFTFPRQKGGSKYCLSDYFCDLSDGQPIDVLPMQAVTVGSKASEYAQSLFNNDDYTNYLYFHGFAVQMAEALAEWTHSMIRKQCGFSKSEPDNIKDILAQRYRGARFSFGYPACPNVSDSRKQLNWLNAKNIAISMDSSDQLHPEQSTTAIIALHSNAKYFSA